MQKPAKSQWDFGELFPTQPVRKILSVSEVTSQIRRLLEKQFNQIWVTGEVSNFKLQSSGHIYFTLRDAGAELSCVLFRNELLADRTLLQDGRKVTLQGELTVYEPRGRYQMRVLAVELKGVGALQIAFEKLKQKLNAEGFFAADRKRPLPRYPQRIGLVTSPTGAAIRDVLHVIQRRNPTLQIILAPCRVQGVGAAVEIAAAVRLLNEFHSRTGVSPVPLDLILLTRGGGSLEDLWPFNEEILARAIYHSALPVVSAIGHEIDFTISDFVADFRAATPSAAAEVITEGVYSSCQFVGEAAGRMRQLARKRWLERHAVAARFSQRLIRLHPRRRLNERLQRLDDLQNSLLRSLKQAARHHQQVFQNFAERLTRLRPSLILKQRIEFLQQQYQHLQDQVHHSLGERRQRLAALESNLRHLGPEQVLSRGYSITLDAQSGKVLREASHVQAGQRLKTRLQAGEVESIAQNRS